MSVSEISLLSGSFQVTVTGYPESSPPILQVNVWSTFVVTDLGVEVTAEMLEYLVVRYFYYYRYKDFWLQL